MKVKIITGEDVRQVEKRVNDFLSDTTNIKPIDIRVSNTNETLIVVILYQFYADI
jgi:hypothetical protein